MFSSGTSVHVLRHGIGTIPALHSEMVSICNTRSQRLWPFLASVFVCWGKKIQFLIALDFQLEDCKCPDVKPFFMSKLLSKMHMAAGGCYSSVAATSPKSKPAWQMKGEQGCSSVFLKHQKYLCFTSTSHSQAVIAGFSQVLFLFDLCAACYYKILNYHLLPRAVSGVYRCKLSNQTVYVQLVSPYSLLLQTSQSKVHKREKQ